MKRTALLLLCLLLQGAAAAAQKAAAPKYDPATETTLKGVVQEVKEVPKSCLGETGVHVMLKAEGGVVEVQIAPADFLKDIGFAVAKGDQVQITASKVVVDGNPLYLAREVINGNNDLVVRDNQGAPVWTWMKKS
jgi:hypothetical protein